VELAHIYRAIAWEEDVDISDNHEENKLQSDKNIAALYENPYSVVKQAFTIKPASNDADIKLLVRRALILRGDCQMELGLYDEAVNSIEEARTLIPEDILEGDALAVVPLSLSKAGRSNQIIEKIQNWRMFDLMAWLTYDYTAEEDQDPNIIFYYAAKLAGKEAYAIQVYEQIITYLDTRNEAGYVRNYLASFYSGVMSDPEKVKEICQKVCLSFCCYCCHDCANIAVYIK